MSYSIFDVNGFVGDIGTNTGMWALVQLVERNKETMQACAQWLELGKKWGVPVRFTQAGLWDEYGWRKYGGARVAWGTDNMRLLLAREVCSWRTGGVYPVRR